MHKKLEEFINKSNGLLLFGKKFTNIQIIEDLKVFVGNKKELIKIVSIHDLFSIESGLMEFVDWKKIDKWTAYIAMSDMTAEQKIKYFLENALLPE